MNRINAAHIMTVIDDTEAALRRLEHRLYRLRQFVGSSCWPELKVGHYEDTKPCDSTNNEGTDQIKEV